MESKLKAQNWVPATTSPTSVLVQTDVGALAGEGVIEWDLPTSISDYKSGDPVQFTGKIINPTNIERVYGILGVWKDKDGYTQHAEALTAVILPAGWSYPFGGTIYGNTNSYFGLELWTGQLIGDSFYFASPNFVCDSIQVFLGSQPFEMGGMIGMIIPLMMIMMIMKIMTGVMGDEK